MPPEFIIPTSHIDVSRVLADRAAIRAVNPQRHEMEHLDAIVLLDTEAKVIAGYKDVRLDEFWARGHMPGNPLLPGVLMCEAAAQLCSYYVMTQRVFPAGHFVGFGGLDEVRFRSVVRPGDRLVLLARAQKLKRQASVFAVQGLVDSRIVFEGHIIGVPIPFGSV
jgi:3-hydroxyacyl-[acyl-carrier-protein] dehydratase